MLPASEWCLNAESFLLLLLILVFMQQVKSQQLIQKHLPLMNILLYVCVTVLFVWEKKEVIAWGKLNSCKQVDKVLKLIYLDADWSAAQWCLNRLLTSVPTLPFFFSFFLRSAAEAHLASGASCEIHFRGENLTHSGTSWGKVASPPPPFFFLWKKKNIAHCFLGGTNTQPLFWTWRSISWCKEMGPGIAKDFKRVHKMWHKPKQRLWVSDS